MPNPNRTYGYRRPTNKRTETIKYVRNSAKTTSSLQDLVNKVKNVVRDVANQITGGGGNTASFTIPKNTPSVRPEVRDGFKQTQGNFNSLLHDDSSKKYGTSFKYNGFDLKSLQEARDIKPSPLDAQRQITDKMAEMAIATAPLTGTSKDKDIAKAAAGQYSEGNITDETQEYLGIISDMWSGKYSYGVTQKEWNEWRKAAFKNTGDYVKNDKGEYELDENGNKIPEFVLRPDAPPPPMGTDEATYKRWEKKNTYLTQVFDEDKQEWVETRLLNENAEEVPKTTEDFKKYWNWYLAFDNQLQDNEKKAIEQSYHMAGIDPNASDSMFDIVRDVISGTDKDPIKGTLDYFKNYVWNPLKKGDWGTLGLNTLVNLGETMDFFASGMRASVASKDVLKFSNSDVLEGQHEFVYSGGEDKQKELMDLGAERLIYLNTHRPRNYKVQAAKIEDKLKAAGKWDDFVQLENEWRAHDNEGSFVQNIKDVYTDPSKNFNADSGNFVKDMVIETILDPSLLIGGATKLAASGGARTVTHSALRAAALARGSEDILNYVESGNKVVRQYLKGAGEGLLMQNKSTIRRNAKNLAETMAKQNVMSETEVDHFVDLITEAIGDVKGNKQYKFIQSMHRADKFVDKMDTALLKTSFIVPYAPFGTFNKTRKLLRNNKRFAEWQGAGRGLREQQAMSELLDGLKNDYGMFRVNSLDELLKRMDENVMLREDPKVKTGVIKNVTEHMKAYMGNIHELSVQLKDGGFSPDEFDEALNLRIRQLSEGKYNSIDEFSDGINAAFNEHAYKYSGELDNIKSVVDKQIKDIDDLKAAAVDEFSVKFYKDLSSAESIEDIQDLIVRVRRFNNSLDTPEVFQGDILKRVNELGLGEFKTTDDLIRKFEFKNAKTVKEPSAVISAVLDNMDEPSKYLNVLHPDFESDYQSFADFVFNNPNAFSLKERKVLFDLFIDESKTKSLMSEYLSDVSDDFVDFLLDNERALNKADRRNFYDKINDTATLEEIVRPVFNREYDTFIKFLLDNEKYLNKTDSKYLWDDFIDTSDLDAFMSDARAKRDIEVKALEESKVNVEARIKEIDNRVEDINKYHDNLSYNDFQNVSSEGEQLFLSAVDNFNAVLSKSGSRPTIKDIDRFFRKYYWLFTYRDVSEYGKDALKMDFNSFDLVSFEKDLTKCIQSISFRMAQPHVKLKYYNNDRALLSALLDFRDQVSEAMEAYYRSFDVELFDLGSEKDDLLAELRTINKNLRGGVIDLEGLPDIKIKSASDVDINDFLSRLKKTIFAKKKWMESKAYPGGKIADRDKVLLSRYERLYDGLKGYVDDTHKSLLKSSISNSDPYDLYRNLERTIKDKTSWMESEKYPSRLAERDSLVLNKFNEVHDNLASKLTSKNISEVDPRELYKTMETQIQNKYLRMASPKYNSKYADSDMATIKLMSDFNKKLIDTQLGLSVTDSRDLLEVHCDMFDVFNKFTSDTRFVNFTNYFKQRDGIVDLLTKAREAYSEFISKVNVNDMILTRGRAYGLLESFKRVSAFNNQIKIMDVYNSFCTRLEQIPGLSQDQYWTILDSVFGFTRNNPEDFYIKNTRNLDAFIDKINLNMDTLFGRSKVSLDGFREEARDFSSDLWKDYSDEIMDPGIQKRVDTILSGGHLDPVQDVRTQMLQVILRDKDAIDYYNSLAKSQDVFFMDIETQGRNTALHEITDLAYMQWRPDILSSDSSLDDILSFIENGISNRHTAKHLAEDIDKNISSETLKYLFSDQPNAGRNELLEQYKNVYAAADEAGVVTEDSILKNFMADMDRSFDARNSNSPVLVTHSTQGFDINFIRDRIQYYKDRNINVYPSHIAHMQDIIDASESTVERLKGLTGDVILTSSQVSAVKDAFITFAKDLPDSVTDLKLLDLDVCHNIFDLPHLLDDPAIKRLIDYGYERGILDPVLEQSLDELSKIFNSKEYTNVFDEFLGFNHDVFLDTKRFNGNLLLDPFPHSNLFKESFDMGDSAIPEVGYRKVGMDTSKYFDFSSETEIPYDITVKCTDFMKDVENIVNNKLKQNTLLENYYDEFVNIVNMTKAYASDLQVGDPFYYFKYLKEPESVNEAYATAQLIWDKTLKYVKDDTIKKYTKTYKGVNALPQTVRDYVLDFAMSGNEFDLFLSDGCRNLLNGNYDESIYKYVISDLYYPKLTTPFEDINDFNIMQSEINEHLKAGSAYTVIAEQYYDSAINYALQDSQKLLSDIAESVKYIELNDKDQFANLLDALSSYHNKRRNTMTAQIMDYVSQSEDNLLSHLLFHNHQLHIPLRGSELHVSQVDQLRELLNNMDAPIVFKEQNGYIHIGLDKDIKYRILNDSRYVDEEATVKIDGRDVIYTCPKYERIDFDPSELGSYLDSSLYIKIDPDGNVGQDIVAWECVQSIFNNMKSVYDQIDFLSEGKGVGSVGTLHTLNRQHQLYKSLPKDFVDNILTEDISCDARFWHQASFDMSCLGDSAYVWKVTDYNDADPLLSMFKTLENIAGSATAEKMYLGYFDDVNSSFKLNNLLNDVSDKEKLEILQNVDDMVVVNFSAMDKYGGFESTTGVEVSALQLNDLTDLKRAEASGAMLVPYDVFLDMQEVFNKSTMTSTFLKGWSKILWLYKVGQLGNPGTWMRNWLDATMKMTAEVGSVGDSARFQLKAAHMLMNYKKISRMIKKNSGLNYTTATDIEREFSRLPERYRRYMTYDEYKFIDDWLQISIAGGESRTLKSVQDYTDNAVNLNIALKQGSTRGVMTPGRVEDLKQVYDLVGSNIERFEDLGEEEITYLIGRSDRKLWDKMDRDRFLQILREGQDTATDEELYNYNEIANKLIEQRFKKIRREHTVSNVMNNVLSGTFKPMSGVEEVVRFAQYLALDERGYTRSQIFNSIVSSQFNYDNKTMRAKMLEMFIPYYGFMDSNLSYWLHALDENPRMLRYVEHIWGNLSWDAAFQYGEDPESNGSVNYMMLHGGVPIGSTGMYLKTEPSFLQPLNMMFGNPSEYLNILAPPFQLGINALLNYGAKEYSSFFHDISTYSFDDKSGLDVFLDNLPIAGSLKMRYVDHFTEKRNWERLVGASDLQKAIVKFNPSMLNVVKRYMVGDADELDLMQGDVEAQIKAAAGTNYIENYLMEHNPALFGALKRQDTSDEDSWDIFLKDLEKDGKWWDANLMQVVPIELKNYDGLNNPNLSFDERARLTFIYHGKLWDANQNRFVEPGQFRPGGLNQDFDLSEPGEWDKLCKLKKKYLDQKWDYNTRSWIPSSEWEPVMLNDPNLSWEDNQRYHRELFGERYDYNQGKYVQKEQFTKGGLNSKRGSLSWEELCALQYALHGKEWIPGEGFVKTTEPIVNFLLPDLDLDKTIKLDRTDPKEKAFISFNLVDVAYADTEDSTLEDEPYEMQGRWILNGNRKHDAAIFAEIIAEYSNKAPGYTGYKTYGPWHNYSSVPRLPKSIQYSKRYSKNKGRKFSYSYTSGGEYAALRMALYGSKIYEDYYKNEFNYNYSYRSPSAGPKKYYGSLYHQGTYNLQGMKNRSEGKWRYYRR